MKNSSGEHITGQTTNVVAIRNPTFLWGGGNYGLREVSPWKTYHLRGVYLNGVSQGAMEGDNFQAATNYPLVRITNRLTHHVFYSRTHEFSSMGVANDDPVTARFDVPDNQEKGPSLLEVVADGVASKPIAVLVK